MRMQDHSSRLLPTTFWHRHTRFLLRYGSLRKYWNLARSLAHYVRGSPRVLTLPSFLKVEISRKCTVHCKYCYFPKADVFFPLDEYRALIDRLGKCLFEVSLYEIGEPLHNEKVAEYIRYAHDRRIATVISSSLSIAKPPDFWEQLVASGLDRLILGIDGITPGVYNLYRTHGDLGLVLSNLRALLAARRRRPSKLFIEWQMVDLPWNRTEQDGARALAKDLGCDAFTLIQEANLSRKDCAKDVYRSRSCILPFLLFDVDAYGQVRTCYKSFHDPMVVGNLHESRFEDIWNGTDLAQIRNKRTITQRVPCRYCLE